MKHFSFKITEKYTIALLDLFNDIQIEYLNSDGEPVYITVPIQFRSKERALNLTDQETEEIIKGNTSIIPRLSLVLSNITRAPERMTNKYVNSHELITPNGKKFMLNSIPYDWSFSLVLLARTVTESAQVIEQITPMFRPTYTLNINEVPLSEEPTTIPLELLDCGMDINDEADNDDVRTIITTFDFTLRGNMYLPLQDTNIIKTVKIYLEDWLQNNKNEYSTAVLIEQKGDYSAEGTKEIQPVTTLDLRPKISKNDPSMVPVITDIIASSTDITVGDKIDLSPRFNDIDNTGDKFAFIWTTNLGLITNGNYTSTYTATATGTATITLIIVDYHGNQSAPMSINFTIS